MPARALLPTSVGMIRVEFSDSTAINSVPRSRGVTAPTTVGASLMSRHEKSAPPGSRGIAQPSGANARRGKPRTTIITHHTQTRSAT